MGWCVSSVVHVDHVQWMYSNNDGDKYEYDVDNDFDEHLCDCYGD